SGKSTLVRTWTGLIPKLRGTIYIENNLRLSLVPQFKNINFSFPLKVKDVILQPQNSKLFFAKKEFTKEEFEILKTFRIHKILNSMIAECSGGQLQKILICRSLFSEAGLIFLDEPLD
ncbi:MAG: ATP-binding cassette domain-containing protein, partial [Leptospiraceae bacterium]|nr:ATP-binding cassette domain-containing protein [Leptospiraceae bacterium]